MPLATYHLATLPNGVRVAAAEMPQMESVAVGLWAAVGSRHEAAARNGAAHFLEHMLFKGTARRSARALSRAVEGVGGELNAFTGEEHTCYYARAAAEHLERLGDVLADMVLRSRFPKAETEREREVILEEIAMVADQPAQRVEDALAAASFPEHPLGRPLSGTAETVAGLSRETLVGFWQAGYHARTLVLSVAGRVTHSEVLTKLGPMLAEAPSGRRTPRFARWRPAPARAVIERQEGEQVQVALGFPAPGRLEGGRFAARVVSALLGESMGSRLFQSLRERRGLCYSVQSATDALAETGLFSIGLGLEAGKVRAALGLIGKELTAICEKPVPARELKEAKDYLVGQHRLGLEGTGSQMTFVGECLLGYGRLVDPDEARRALEGVTGAEVQAAARAMFAGPPPALALVGPVEAGEAELRGWLGR